MKQIIRTRCARLVFAAVLTAPFGLAQVTNEGTVRGFVRDEQGSPMPGVTITATSADVAGALRATTEGDGEYRLLNMAPGVYSLAAESTGFAKAVRTGIEVRAGLNLTVDFSMKLGKVEETITVSEESPLLETEKAVQAVNVAALAPADKRR